MKNKKLFIVIAVTILLTVSLLGFSACDSINRDVDSIECYSVRGGEVSWAMGAEYAMADPYYKMFSSTVKDIDKLVEQMKGLSPQYTYESYSPAGLYDELYVVFNNDSEYPSTFLIMCETTEKFDYLICDMLEEYIPFPFHLLSVYAESASISDKSAYVIKGTIEQLKQFYERNNFSVVVNASTLEITDKIPQDYKNYSSYYCEPFSIEFSVINENNNLIVYHMPE